MVTKSQAIHASKATKPDDSNGSLDSAYAFSNYVPATPYFLSAPSDPSASMMLSGWMIALKSAAPKAPASPATVSGQVINNNQVLYAIEPGTTNAISPLDIQQGEIGDCWVLSAIGDLAIESPSSIQNMITNDGNGTYTVKLYNSLSLTAEVTSQNYLSYGIGDTGLTQVTETVTNVLGQGGTLGILGDAQQAVPETDSNGNTEIWVDVLEEAVAQLFGGYNVIGAGGLPYAVFEALTGQASSTVLSPADMGSSSMVATLLKDASAGDLISFSSSIVNAGVNTINPYNLVTDHAYMFDGFTTINGQTDVLLLNPWGVGEAFADADPHALTGADGVFHPFEPTAIPLDQLADYFEDIEIGSTAPGSIVVAAPTITKINIFTGSTLPASGGQAVAITVQWNAAITVVNTVSLALSDGGTASYIGGSGTNTLTFSYVVPAGENAGSLTILGINESIPSALTGNTDTDLINEVYSYYDLTGSAGQQASTYLGAATTQHGNITSPITAAQVAANLVALENSSSFASVSDNAANVGANLNALQALAASGRLLAITLTDATTPTLALTAVQVVADMGVLNSIVSTYKISVTDTAANIAKNFDILEALTTSGELVSVTPTDSGIPVLQLTALQTVNDASALSEISGPYKIAITDNAANVISCLPILESLAATGKIASITLTDSTEPLFNLTVAQLEADAPALSKITSPYMLMVSDTMVNVLNNLTSLGALATADKLAPLNISVNDTAANVVAGLSSLQTLTTANKTPLISISVTDTTLEVSSYLDILEPLAASGQLSYITMTDRSENGAELFLTVAQLKADTAAIDSIVSGYHMAIYDTMANIVANLPLLESLVRYAPYSSGVIRAITASDTIASTVALTMDQIASYGAVFDTIYSRCAFSLSGTAASVVANYQQLFEMVENNDTLSITLTDGTKPSLNLTAFQIIQQSAVLAVIHSPYTLDATDTISNVLYCLPELKPLAASGRLASINVTDTLTMIGGYIGSLPLTASGKLPSWITATVTDNAANVQAGLAQLEVLEAKGLLTSINVNDTAANVLATLPTLESLAASGKLPTSITASVTDGAANVLADLAGLEVLAAKGALTSINVNDTAANVLANLAQIEVLAAKGALTSINVVDTATNVAANFDALNTLAASGQLTSIYLDPNGTTLQLTMEQFTNDTAAIGKIAYLYNPYVIGGVPNYISVSGVSAANAHTVASIIYVSGITVTDTMANVMANLGTLEALAVNEQLTYITTTGSVTDVLSDSNKLNLLVASGALPLISMNVSDTAANIAANLNALETVANKLTSITLTDTATPVLTLTATQLTADSAVLNSITGAYTLTVTNVLVANAASVIAQPHVTAITVSDTAANVLANLAALESLAVANKLYSIAFTDTTIPTLTLTAAQVTADAAALGKITGTYNLMVADTVPNVLANLAALETLAAANKLTSITLLPLGQGIPLTNTPLTITALQAALYGAALQKIANTHMIAVSDNTANVTANLSALETLAATNKLIDIRLTDASSVTVTAAQAAVYGTALAELSNAVIQVNDTAANVIANMATLQSLAANQSRASIGKLTSILLTGTNNLTEAQFAASMGSLAQITTAYILQPNGDLQKWQNGSWTLSATGISSFQIAPNGTVYLLQGSTLFSGTASGNWTAQAYDISSFQVAPNGTVYLLQGTNLFTGTSSANWTLSATGISSFQIAPNGTAYLLQGSTLFSGTASANWNWTIQAYDISSFQIAPNGTVYLLQGTNLFTGTSSANWTLSATGISSFQIAPNGTVYLLQGSTLFSGTSGANWTAQAYDISSFQVAPNGTVYLLQGTNLFTGTSAANWTLSATGISSFQIAPNGTAYLLQGSTLFSGTASANWNWTIQAYDISSFQIAPNGTVYLLQGSTLFSGTSSANWTALETGISSFQLVPSGTVYTLQSNGALNALSNGVWSQLDAGVQSFAVSSNGLLSITGTAANVAANLAALETLVNGGTLSSITLSNSGTPVLNLTTAQMLTEAAVLKKITSPYTLSVTGGNSGNSNDVLNVASFGTTNTTLTGGGGNDNYAFGSAFGQDTINNLSPTATTANGQINFGAGITDEKLWLQKSGNNLVIDLLGTHDSITVSNWFGGNASAQVAEITTADGLKLDNQVTQLVSAMAAYGASQPAFNPATSSQMPTDGTLQAAIAAAWHH